MCPCAILLSLASHPSEDKDYVSQSAVPKDSETHGGEDVAIYSRGELLVS